VEPRKRIQMMLSLYQQNQHVQPFFLLMLSGSARLLSNPPVDNNQVLGQDLCLETLRSLLQYNNLPPRDTVASRLLSCSSLSLD
jgi:hypothetical protein